MSDWLRSRLRKLFDRRTAVKGVLGAVTGGYGLAILYPIWRYLTSGIEASGEKTAVSEVTLGKDDELKPGSAKPFMFGNKPAVAIRRKTGDLTAFLTTCTHLGCTVRFVPEDDKIRCGCHGGVYDPASGKNIGGPPPSPLGSLVAAVENGSIVVRRPEKKA